MILSISFDATHYAHRTVIPNPQRQTMVHRPLRKPQVRFNLGSATA